MTEDPRTRGLTAEEREGLRRAIDEARRGKRPRVVSQKRRTRLGRAEHDVLRLTAEGFSVREIAATRGTSPSTTADQRNKVLWKLGARNAAHAVAIGFRAGLLK